jgi:hypothetical protein
VDIIRGEKFYILKKKRKARYLKGDDTKASTITRRES